MIRLALLALLVVGCDQVFGLQRDPNAAACGEALLPDGDNDHDSKLNSVDACPLVPNEEAHDEDGDDALDACDLCPGLVEAGADVDCDGVGAACDPDDSTPHVQRFFGFGSSAGLRLDNAVVQSDALRAPTASTAGIAGGGYAVDRVPAAGIYEMSGTFTRTTNPPTQDFGYVGMRFTDASNSTYLVRISGGYSTGDVGSFQIQLGSVALVQKSIGGLPLTGSFTMTVTISPTTIDATIAGFVSSSLSAPIAAPLGAIEYGIETYHDAANMFSSEIASLRRVALAP